MGKNGKLEQDAKDKKVNVPKRLGILIIPAGFLFVILLAFCVFFPDFWYLVFWECIKEVLLHGGFLITMLINILWISNAFINIHSFLGKSNIYDETTEKNGPMGIKHPLLNPPNQKMGSMDYSFLFFELTVRFLVLVGLEISVCYVFYPNSLSEVLALTLPMVTVFIVCSCFLVSKNDKLVSNAEELTEKNFVVDNIKAMIQNLNYPLRICNRNKGKFYVSMNVIQVIMGSINARLECLEVQHNHGRIQLLSPSKYVGTFEMFFVPTNQMIFWKGIKDSDKVKMFLRYAFHSTLRNKESEVTLVVNLSSTDNRCSVL